MATTWTSVTPSQGAIQVVHKTGLGSGYGPSGNSTCLTVKWPGNKRAVVTRLSAESGGTYTTGGDDIDPKTFGLREIQSMFIIATNSETDVRGRNNTGGTHPVLSSTDPTAPKVQLYVNNAQLASGESTTSITFHAILVGV